MNRRIVYIILLGLVLLLLVFAFYFLVHRTAGTPDPIKAIPVDASIIVRINDYSGLDKTLFNNCNIWSSLSQLESISQLNYSIKFIDSVCQAYADISQIINHSGIYISGHQLGGKRTDYLFLIHPQTEFSKNNLINNIEELSNHKIDKKGRLYEGVSIFTFNQNGFDPSKQFYFSVDKGIILFSKSVILIENAIRQINLPKSLLDDEGFSNVLTTTGKNKSANLYINFQKFVPLLSAFISNNYLVQWKGFEKLGGWTELDINSNENQLIVNGFVIDIKAETNFLGMFSGGVPVEISCDKVLPASVSAFVSFGINDPSALNDHYNSYLESNGNRLNRSKKIDKFNNDFGTQLTNLFLSIIDNEIAIAKGISENDSRTSSTIVVVKCKSGRQAKDKMDALALSIANKNKIEPVLLNQQYQVDSETQYPIVYLAYPNITGLLFGQLFDLPDKTYYTFLDNYLIFSESVESLGQVIYNYVLSRTLSTNEMFRSFRENIAQKSYLLFYTNLSRSSAIFKPYLQHEKFQQWENNSEVFQKVQPFGFQVSQVSNLLYINGILQYVDAIKNKPQTVWESLLDTTLNFKPQLIENHNTRQNEIFLQDNNNTIYLINKAGRILWKEKLSEPINSAIYQVDYFKNGKLQLLFSTSNFIHLIDRNGNYVERYPLRLRDKASAGLALFDYENDRNYRIAIPCVDKNIYLYDIQGTLIPGWKFDGSDYPIWQPVNNFVIGDKDYLVFGDKYHTYILDRKGNTRVEVNTLIPKSFNNTYNFEEKGTPENSRLVITDTLGNICSVFFDGKVQTTSVGLFSPAHYFDFKDVDGDGERDYIFLDGNVLSVYRQDKSKLWSFAFPHEISEIPIYFKFSAQDRKIGLVDRTDQKIYLINKDGTIYKGFPLEGSTLFSIGYLEFTEGAFNLIVGGRNNFLYNYAVQ